MTGVLPACSSSPSHLAPPPAAREPPARVLAATEGRVSLQASAYVELHAWLANAAKTNADVGSELEPAVRAYARSLTDDDADVLLERTTRLLSTCADDRCAIAALAPTGFGRAFERALPSFIAHQWMAHATAGWIGIEASHAVLVGRAESTDVVFARAASDLGVTWPDHPVHVDVVADTPPVSRDALIPVALAARGSCFFTTKEEQTARLKRERLGLDDRMHDARILDCLMVHALFGAHQPTALRVALVRALGIEHGERAWSVLVIHAVAATVTGWEPRHLSAYRRSAMTVEGKALDWLAHEWHGHPVVDAFAARYAAQWRDLHPGGGKEEAKEAK